uniref:GUN4-like domain-containing protein n=1 Tax=Polysiphonia sertularioides TaxID=945028 RepID=A0A1Z1M936_9FLOR|nr:hypothetical protein [Polysiphonia sertularioides]ARW62403.1 hypothetical protein [Polysiphonia sertularioides]
MKKAEKLSEEIDNIFTKKDKTLSFITQETIEKLLKNKDNKDTIVSKIIEHKKKSTHNYEIVGGFIYQKIIQSKDEEFIHLLSKSLPNGIITINNSSLINYQPLQNLLIEQKFQEADKLTQKYLCQLVEIKTKKIKKWLYFTDIQFIPKDDLFTIDLLWKSYSIGKFGFSVQKEIWTKSRNKWDTLWEKIRWLEVKEKTMKRYPEEFIWTTEAPEGHLPLFNQLRGTQTLSHLFQRIEW